MTKLSVLNQMKLANEIYAKIQDIEHKEKQLNSIAKLCISQTDEISDSSISISIYNITQLDKPKKQSPNVKFNNDGTVSLSVLNSDNSEIPLSHIGGFMGMLMSSMPSSLDRKQKNKSEDFNFKLSNSLLLKIIAIMQNELTHEKTMLIRKYEKKINKEIVM